MRTVSFNDKWDLTVPNHRADWLEQAMPWEPEKMDSLFLNCKRGDVVMDIGSEESDETCLVSKWTYAPEGGGVILVEPTPWSWPNAKAIFDANDQLPLGCLSGFASEPSDSRLGRAENRPLPCWPDDVVGPVAPNRGFANVWERPDISSFSVDEICRILGQTPDIVAIDVEGAEFKVIRGAEETINEHRPLLYISIHPQIMLDSYQERASDLHRHLAKIGYVPHCLAERHEDHYVFEHPDGRRMKS